MNTETTAWFMRVRSSDTVCHLKASQGYGAYGKDSFTACGKASRLGLFEVTPKDRIPRCEMCERIFTSRHGMT